MRVFDMTCITNLHYSQPRQSKRQCWRPRQKASCHLPRLLMPISAFVRLSVCAHQRKKVKLPSPAKKIYTRLYASCHVTFTNADISIRPIVCVCTFTQNKLQSTCRLPPTKTHTRLCASGHLPYVLVPISAFARLSVCLHSQKEL